MSRGNAFLGHHDPGVIYEIASRGKTYVEIGTRWGGSAIVAGLAGCEVHCIDPWEYPEKRIPDQTTLEDVRNNWKHAGLDPYKLRLHQNRHPPWPEAIQEMNFDIGMIDGEHTEEQCRLDWEGMKAHVSKYVLFHDISKSAVRKVFLAAVEEPEWEFAEPLLGIGSQFGILKHASNS